MRRLFESLTVAGMAAIFAFFPHVAGAATPTELWSFSAGSWVTVVEPIADLSQPLNGGQDLLVGSADDTLYLVEGHGSGAGGELWRFPMRSTVTAIKAVGDVDGDNRPDVLAGDMGNVVSCISGGTGKALWAYLTRGSILCLAEIPDVNSDGVPDFAVGSEDDTVYCFSGAVAGMKSSTQLGEVIWKFATAKSHPLPPVLQKTTEAGPPIGVGPNARPQGANALAVISNTSSHQVTGIIIGASSDTVFCVSTAGQNGVPTVLWKCPAPGDVWDVKTCGDVDGDHVQDVLVACGADISYLISGKTGTILWSCKASGGAQVALAIGDVNGDGVEDGIVGDGYGSVRCISGASRGENVTPLWTFTINDSSTITSLATPGDLNGNGKSECIVGSSNDSVYIISDAGSELSSVSTNGTVYSVAAIADPHIAGVADFVAGSGSSFATVYSGKETTSVVSPGSSNKQTFAHSFQMNVPAFTITDLLGRMVAGAGGGSSGISAKRNRGERLSAGKYVSSVRQGANGVTVIKGVHK